MLLKSLLASVITSFALAANAEVLVLAAPFSEYPALASQMLDGAKAATPANWDVKQVDAGCSLESAADIAGRITAEKPDAIVGLPCIESLTPVLGALGPLGVPIITIASRAEAPSKLAVKNQWQLLRIGPRENEEAAETAKLLVTLWQGNKVAILDDGTIFARDTAEALRNTFETAGTKPALVEGFQPQLENQKKLIDKIVSVGATHIFIAGDRANVAQISTEAAGLSLTFAGPESLRANDLDYTLPAGILMVAQDKELNDATAAKIMNTRQTPFALAEGYSSDAFIAAEIAIALKANSTLRTFNTAMGQLVAADDGFVGPVKYALFRFDGTAFVKVSQ